MSASRSTSPATTREEERRHLAVLLERHVAPSLRRLLSQIVAYQAALAPSDRHVQAALHRLAEMAESAQTELAGLVAGLHPDDLDSLGLNAALETLAARIDRRYGLDTTLDLDPDLDPPPPVALGAYRIAQEALHNAGQHGAAGRVGLSAHIVANTLQLTVADDGRGFRPPEPLSTCVAEGSRGLAEMVTQAEELGGQVEVSSVMGVGTQVRCVLPFSSHQPRSRHESGGMQIEPLTPREREILAGVTAGLTNKQIAAQLGISPRTAQFHLGNVLAKLGVASRTEAAVFALQHSLVHRD